MSTELSSLACIKCKFEFEVFTPKVDVIEAATISALVWAHPEPQRCPKCGQGYQMQVMQLKGFTIGFKPVQTKEDARLVIPPPPGLKIQ